MMTYVAPLIFAVAIIGTVIATLPSNTEQEDQRINGQVEQYQAFIRTADLYFAANPAPGSTTAYYWSTIKTHAASGQKDAEMPPHWKVVRKSDGDWVACTELNETTLAALGKLIPTQSVTVGTGTVSVVPTPVPTSSITAVIGTGGSSESSGTPTYVVMGQTGSNSATSANLCAGT